MDYCYENLCDERFQQFCQSLLLREFPHLQCFPVGQRDGGRDAVTWQNQASAKEFAVYQVKFVRRPLAEQDPHKRLIDILDDESKNIAGLITKGARQYFLLTNVAGTAYPGSGSIDALQAMLSKRMQIPVTVFWRDDLNRRLDGAYDIKWAFPQLLSGSDVLRLIIENGLSESRERRTLAVRTALQKQFEQDSRVRFKQVEIDNQLFDMFVDVPIGGQNDDAERWISHFAPRLDEDAAFARPAIGAAALFLHPGTDKRFSHVVLEGAPGQGKSTVTQYICQVYRSRILNTAPQNLLSAHAETPLLLPLRIDLRDFATWLNRNDPFSPEENTPLPKEEPASLEALIAAQIRNLSGGATFNVTDLQAVAQLSSLLVVLDGLDEVADLKQRKNVVQEIISAMGRLKSIAASLRVIVTSRPNAYGTSLGFPPKRFTYLHLQDLRTTDVIEYGEKWIRARRLQGKEAGEAKRLLKQKIDQPHLRDLARNPMQLSILLSLLHTKGSSLPEKRTALYDYYVDLFLNREAEKSEIVREHRSLLIDLHQHLAWILHSESQLGKHRGNVSDERLRLLIRDYLKAEDQPENLLISLFSGLVERVVFLVSRVEGSYEFEVQPLREYFTARHLYETAPYSPSGAPAAGTKPDRFDAIAKTAYWLNVTRFFAGCFSKGELPCLIARLQELAKVGGFKHTTHARRLAALFLSDYVFNQDKRSTREAVALVLQGVVNRSALDPRRGPDEVLTLPKGCGAEEIVESVRELLSPDVPFDYALELMRLFVANSSPEVVMHYWDEKTQAAHGKARQTWLEYGYYLGCLSVFDISKLNTLLNTTDTTPQLLSLLIRAGLGDFLLHSGRGQSAVQAALAGFIGFSREADILSRFCTCLTPEYYFVAFDSASPTPLSRLDRRYFSTISDKPSSEPFDELTKKCWDFAVFCEAQRQIDSVTWARTTEPWSRIIEEGRRVFGECRALVSLAIFGSGIRDHADTCTDSADIFDSSKDLFRRIRYARLRSGQSNWWQDALSDCRCDKLMRVALIATLFRWGSCGTIARTIEKASERLDQLSEEEFTFVFKTVHYFSYRLPNHKGISDTLIKGASSRAAALLAGRCDHTAIAKLLRANLGNGPGSCVEVMSFVHSTAWMGALRGLIEWEDALLHIRRAYKLSEGRSCIHEHYHYRHYELGNSKLTVGLISSILSRSLEYPRSFVASLEAIYQTAVEEELPPVAEIAATEKWFPKHAASDVQPDLIPPCETTRPRVRTS